MSVLESMASDVTSPVSDRTHAKPVIAAPFPVGCSAVCYMPTFLFLSCLPACSPSWAGPLCSLLLFQSQCDQHIVDIQQGSLLDVSGPHCLTHLCLPCSVKAGPSLGGKAALLIIVTPASDTEAGR